MHAKESTILQFQQTQTHLTKTIDQLTTQVIDLNPLAKLSNGFIYGETKNKIPIKTIQQLDKNDTIYMTLKKWKGSGNNYQCQSKNK